VLGCSRNDSFASPESIKHEATWDTILLVIPSAININYPRDRFLLLNGQLRLRGQMLARLAGLLSSRAMTRQRADRRNLGVTA
jgi:hypothetical protein